MIRFIHDCFLTFSEADLERWLIHIATGEGYTVKKLEYNFVDSNTLFTINKEYLNHDTYTDIVTFDYTENKAIKAEAYISCDALKENAKKYRQSAERECLRLLSHALLHCLGFNDKSIEEKALMRSKEEDCINLFHVKH